MSISENKQEKAEEDGPQNNNDRERNSQKSTNSSSTKSSNNALKVDTSKTKRSTNNSDPTQSPSINVIQTQYRHRSSSGGGNITELPTDTRPKRIQRSEDLKRAQYLTTNPTLDDVEKEDTTKVKNNTKPPPSCWITTSWILTWWAPPFLLRTFGKINE